MSVTSIDFFCPNSPCDIFKVRIPHNLAVAYSEECPACRTKLEVQEKFSIDDLSLPEPLVILEKRYRDLQDPDSMVKALTDLYTFASKHLAFISEGEYLASGIDYEDLNKTKSEFRLPYLSTYTSWLEDYEKFVRTKNTNSKAKDIATLYEMLEIKLEKSKRISTEGGYYDISGDWVTTKGDLGIFRGLLNFRNTSTHFFNPRDRDAMEVIATYEVHVYHLLREMAKIPCIQIYPEGRTVFSRGGFKIPSILFMNNEYYYYEQYEIGNKVLFFSATGNELQIEEKEWLS